MAHFSRTLAMGFFDGVHIGHGALLNMAKQRAAETGTTASVLSFDVHPDTLVSGKSPALLTDTQSREEIIKRCFGIEDIIFIHFNRHVMNMDWKDFTDEVVRELGVTWFVVGHDFRFGRKGEGTAEKLKEFCEAHGTGCDIIPAVTLDGRVISSTFIRTLVERGEMEEAARYLGHRHCLYDTVHSGYHIGRKLDAPTINMFFPQGVIEPRHGVYAAKVVLKDGAEYPAVTNIGIRPTVSTDNSVSVESHLLNFSGNLYGQPARVDFYRFIRPEKKFDSFEALSEQIKADVEKTHLYFSRTF